MKEDFEKIVEEGIATKNVNNFGRYSQELCKKYGISERTLYSRFTSVFGKSPKNAIAEKVFPSKETLTTLILNCESSEGVRLSLGLSNRYFVGLDLWLSGIGRPTGNARTERVMGTLRREEIDLQDQYDNESEGSSRIGTAILDYNLRRPNAGNGGFAPNSVHIQGRSVLTERRKEARQHTENLRRNHWDQVQPC